MEVWNAHESDDDLSSSPDRKGKRIKADPDWLPSDSEGGESSDSYGGEDQQHETGMNPAFRRNSATKVEREAKYGAHYEDVDLQGEENFLNVTDYSLKDASYFLETMETMEEHESYRMEPMEPMLQVFQSMGSSHYNLDDNDNDVNKYLNFPSQDDSTGKQFESHNVSVPLFKEGRMVPLGVLNPLFDTPKEHHTSKFPPILEKEDDIRTPLAPLHPNYPQGASNIYPKAEVHPHDLEQRIQNTTSTATTMAIMGAQHQQAATSLATHQAAPRGATTGTLEQATPVVAQYHKAHVRATRYSEFDVIEGVNGNLEYYCLFPGCLGSGIHPTTRRALHSHRKAFHPNINHHLPRQGSIAKWLSLGKPRPYDKEANRPRKMSHSKVQVHDQFPMVSSGPLGPTVKPPLPRVCSLESLPRPLLIDTSMVARSSPYPLEDPVVPATSLATFEGQVVAATRPTSFKGLIVSATSLETLEDHGEVATTPSSFEVTNPVSFDVPIATSPSPDSIEDFATQPSTERPQLEAFELDQGVAGNHGKETMIVQELSDGQVHSDQAAPEASVPDALTLFLEDLDREEMKLFSEQATKEIDNAFFDF